MTVLELRKAVVEYPERRALDGIDLAVSEGELVALVGPNGSGKSTALKLFAGVLAPTSGEALLEGRAAARLPRDEAARLAAYVPQAATVTFDVTALEVALMGRHPFGRGLLLDSPADVKLADEALALAGARDLRDRPFLQMSGGEKQRVVLARAIAQGSRVLLLDEPTSAQDPSHALEIFDLVKRLAKERKRAVVVATHDVNAAARSSDRIVALERGRIARAGTPAEILVPEVLRATFGVEALTGTTPAGAPYFVPVERAGATK